VKSASTTPNTQLPETPPNDVTGGLDWARDDHAVAVVDARGREVVRRSVEHTAAGLVELIDVRRRAGCREVAIERPDGPVVDALLGAGLTVVVISPNQVKNLRGRYGSAGNKDDRFDAFVLADTLRTDRARLRALVPDTPATVALRRTCRARRDLVAHRVGVANQLRAQLRAVFPGAVGLFADIDSPITLAFLTRFTTQEQADWLSPTRFRAWLSKQGYSGKVDPAMLHQRLLDAPRGAVGPEATANAPTTRALVAVLVTLLAQIKTLAAEIDTQLDAHADAHIFTSLPRAGRVHPVEVAPGDADEQQPRRQRQGLHRASDRGRLAVTPAHRSRYQRDHQCRHNREGEQPVHRADPHQHGSGGPGEADHRQGVTGEALPTHHHEPAHRPGEYRHHPAGAERVDHEREVQRLTHVGHQVPGELGIGSGDHRWCRSAWTAGLSGCPTTTRRPSEVESTSTGVRYSRVSVSLVITARGAPTAAPPSARYTTVSR